MVFFVLTGGLSGTFANLLIPLQVGARDMASGFLNMLSYWFFLLSSMIMVASLFVEGGAASGGWTIYPPLSALPQAMPGSGTGMTLWLISMVFFIASSLLGGLNYIVTIINLRTKGMKMTRLPLTMWALFVTAILGVLSFPVLVSAAVLLLMDRSFGTAFYLSDIFIQGEALDVTAAVVPALVLVPWSPGGIHCTPAGFGYFFGSNFYQLSQANLRLQGDGGFYLGNRLLVVHRVGSPHVCNGYESVPRFCIRIHYAFDCDSFSSKGVQLHHYTVSG
jgi:hypothetical protein